MKGQKMQERIKTITSQVMANLLGVGMDGANVVSAMVGLRDGSSDVALVGAELGLADGASVVALVTIIVGLSVGAVGGSVGTETDGGGVMGAGVPTSLPMA
jgi:hypothetical protein